MSAPESALGSSGGARRTLLALGLSLLVAACERGRGEVSSASPIGSVRIGYQKSSVLVLVKWKGTLDRPLGDKGMRVEWAEFPTGPALLEA